MAAGCGLMALGWPWKLTNLPHDTEQIHNYSLFR